MRTREKTTLYLRRQRHRRIKEIARRGDRDHARIRSVLAGERRPFVIPAATLGEIAYLIDQRPRPPALEALVADIERGGFSLDCGDQDWPRARLLLRRYADFPLGLVDAAVVACAERNGGRVLTLDRRHFGAVAREGTITVLP